MSGVVTAFDSMAAKYDVHWSHSGIGRMQRNAVWRHLEPIVRPGIRVLDLGCGTGEDARWLISRGAFVDAADASPEMVRVAQAKGIPARVARMEEIGPAARPYDLVLSNFGALNCVEDLTDFGCMLAELVRPGGAAALCLLNTFCAWETALYVMRGQFGKAARRLRRRSRSSMGVDVFYHSRTKLREVLGPTLSLTRDVGIGIAIPPSYGPRWSETVLSRCAAADRGLGATALGRAIADHRLFIFKRTES
jgi:SAM-dependent methyltransferase